MGKNIGNSLKWSTAGELFAKLAAPITNMILARILVPEDFGILAMVNMIITFVDLFTDSGFVKYIIQRDFKNEKETEQYINVAFWTNLVLSVFLWSLIFILKTPLALMVGAEGHEKVIVIAATQLVLTSFSSVQTAIYRKYFDFKTLFIVRILTSIIPLCITVPLAYIIKNYWALVIGAIILQLINAIFLTIKSKWKPKPYYSFAQLKNMLSFSIWSLAEAVAYWFTIWFDVFIIGAAFTAYYAGIYKNSLNMVNSVMQIVKASIIPILFSSLSKLKNDKKGFISVFSGLQESAAFILIPMGIGLFVFKDITTLILFGAKWMESSNIIGAWALASCFQAAYVNFFGEAFKAKGIPKILFFYELVCLAIMIPVCQYAKIFGFWQIVYTRASIVIIQIIIGFLFMKKYLNFSILNMIKNIAPSFFCAGIMGVFGYYFKNIFPENKFWQIFSIALCATIYFLLYFIIFRKRLKNLIKVFKNKKYTEQQP